MIEKDVSKKKLPSSMYDDFHAHVVGTNLKNHELIMHWKLKRLYSYIYTEETYMISKSSHMISVRFVKDIDSFKN